MSLLKRFWNWITRQPEVREVIDDFEVGPIEIKTVHYVPNDLSSKSIVLQFLNMYESMPLTDNDLADLSGLDKNTARWARWSLYKEGLVVEGENCGNQKTWTLNTEDYLFNFEDHLAPGVQLNSQKAACNQG